jgi:hypothetical protein
MGANDKRPRHFSPPSAQDILTGGTCLMVMAACYLGLNRLMVYGEMPNVGLTGWICRTGRISRYFPGILRDFGDWPRVAWFMDYLPLCLAAGIVVALFVRLLWMIFVIKPKPSLLDDPYHVVRRLGVNTPPLNHLKDLLLVCPLLDREAVLVDFQQAQIDLYAPASTSINLHDGPSEEQMARYREEEQGA